MPLQRYQSDLKRPDFVHDPAQEQAVLALQRVRDALLAGDRVPARPATRSFTTWLRRRDAAPEPVRGLYIWGGVGRGKTYLVDTFHDALPIERKMRLHFHRFMQRVHRELGTLRQQPQPLETVAERLAAEARVLCLDEFFVSDITDAMILHGLLKALLARGVTLVATSNIAPRDLYRDGLQRARFIPAIELLERHVDVLHMDGGVDYRLRFLETAEIIHHPLDGRAEEILAESFTTLAPEPGVTDTQLAVEGREIPTRRLADGVVWFAFEAICEGPRSQMDYIEIARCFHTVLISGVPVLDVLREDAARRFISLVDEFYDRGVKLILSMQVAPAHIYQGRRLGLEFARTLSRLAEMQSREYLARPHLP